MKPLEQLADSRHCELCGALRTPDGADPVPDHPAAEMIRRLALVATECPALAILLIHHVAGRSERQIAAAMKLPQSTVHDRIKRAQKEIRSLRTQ